MENEKLENLEPVLSDRIGKEEIKASKLYFHEETFATISTKYDDWALQNENPKKVKADMMKEAKKYAEASSDEERAEIAENISMLFSKCKFLSTHIKDEAIVAGNRAIKLNLEMIKNTRKNREIIETMLKEEIVDVNKTKAKALSDDARDEFIKSIDGENSQEIDSKVNNDVPEEPIIEENEEPPKSEVNDEVQFESEAQPEESADNEETKHEEAIPEEEAIKQQVAPMTEKIEDNEVPDAEKEAVAEEANDSKEDEVQSTNTEEAEEAEKELNLNDLDFESSPSGLVTLPGNFAQVNEDVDEENADEKQNSEEKEEDTANSTEEETESAVEENSQEVNFVPEDVVNMDAEEVAEKKEALNGRIIEDFNSLKNREKEAIKEGQTLDDNLAEATKKYNSLDEEVKRKNEEKRKKLEAFRKQLEVYGEKVTREEEANTNKQKQLDSINEETRQLDEKNEKLDLDIAELDSLLKSVNNDANEEKESKTK